MPLEKCFRLLRLLWSCSEQPVLNHFTPWLVCPKAEVVSPPGTNQFVPLILFTLVVVTKNSKCSLDCFQFMLHLKKQTKSNCKKIGYFKKPKRKRECLKIQKEKVTPKERVALHRKKKVFLKKKKMSPTEKES